MSACVVHGCRGEYVARGYCSTHYQRVRRWGSSDLHKVPAEPSVDLVLERGNVDRTGECWLWRSTFHRGYGVIGLGGRGGKVWLAHRLLYTLANGEVAEGLVLHHVCRNPACVNPRHLEPMSRRDHVLIHDGRKASSCR